MSDPDCLSPRSPSRRRSIRRDGPQDRRAEGEARIQLPVAIPKVGATRGAIAKAGLDQVSEFAAQLIGQGVSKRGLRGGPETLDKARGAYLGAEWSGPSDRRPQAGRITKTEI